jgi:L-threonylcarbamoyladenylate synthase
MRRLNTHVRLTTSPAEAAHALAQGHLVAIPTETVYGLGANAEDPAAVARIFHAKGRPTNHPLIVHLANATAVGSWAHHIPAYAQQLMDAFWPGPMTLVLTRSPRASDAITGGQDTVGLRVSSHSDVTAILKEFASLTHPSAGIAAPSANRFGRVSPTSAEHVLAEFADNTSDDDLVFDGGTCSIGVESTIIDCTGDAPVILRSGAISADDISHATGLAVGITSHVRASGMLDVHYAPHAAVHLIGETDTPTFSPQAGFIALAHIPTPPECRRIFAPNDGAEYAHGIYAALRSADQQGITHIYVIPPPATGIGVAVNDRLARAAAATSGPSEVRHPNE